MQTRKCTRCGITKSLDQFYQRATKYKDGSPKHHSQCSQCLRNYTRTRYYQVKVVKNRTASHTPLPTPLPSTQQAPRPLSRLPQRPPFRQVQPPPKPAKPPTERHLRGRHLGEPRYVVDEYSQVDPNSDD